MDSRTSDFVVPAELYAIVDIKIFSTNEEYKTLESFLATRLYEFNAAATGVSDAQYLRL